MLCRIRIEKVFFRALKTADYFWFAISLVLSFFSHLSRAIRWQYMLEPIGYTTSLFNRYNALMIGYVMNLLIPRAGEASRAGILYQTEGVPFTKSFGTIIAERVFDVLMLGIIVLLALFFSYDDLMELVSNNSLGKSSEKGGSNILLMLGGACVLFSIIGILVWKFVPSITNKFVTLFKGIIAGIFSIFKSKKPWKFIMHTLFIWGSYIFFFSLCFYSLEETKDIPIGGILIGFIAGTLGVMFTNGGMGAYPLLVGIVIAYYLGDTLGSDEARGIGNALGMMIWASQTVLMIVLGLISLLAVQKSKKK